MKHDNTGSISIKILKSHDVCTPMEANVIDFIEVTL